MNSHDVIGLPVAERVSVSAMERKPHGFRDDEPRAAVTSSEAVTHRRPLPEGAPNVPIGLSAHSAAAAIKPDEDIGLHLKAPFRGGSRTNEFPPDAHTWLPEMSRRRFVELMGASLALAGMAGCNRPPQKQIVPFVEAPDREISDRALFYATAIALEGYGRGLLVQSREGRPTKIEGNPAHPESLGATDAITQAAILSLYDPDRSRAPRRGGGASAWTAFEAEWLARRTGFAATNGAGLALLSEPTTSPTALRAMHRLLDTFPAARWYQHTALPRHDDDGVQEDYDFAAADVVLAVDADFLFQLPASLRYARAFASRRRVMHGRIRANRLYAIEPTPSVTGSMADHRLPLSPTRLGAVLNAIAQAIAGETPTIALEDAERAFVQYLVADLKARGPNVVCIAGPHLDPEVRRWCVALNARLGAYGKTVRRVASVRSDGDARCAGDLSVLTHALRAGEVTALFVLGSNPVHTAPADLAFRAVLPRAEWRVHLGSHVDETARCCDWHLPESHFLESWGDLRGYDGTATIVQPLIAPLYASRSAIELLSFLSDPPGRDGYELVRETWGGGRRPEGQDSEWRSGTSAATSANTEDFEVRWTNWLNRGVVDEDKKAAARTFEAADDELPLLPVESPRDVIVLRADPTIGDGRWANNAWLQELPKPVTNLVWENAALVSSAFAARHGLEENDVVRLRTTDGDIAAPVWIVPGQADGCVTLHFGYGRTHAGSVGNGQGVDAYRIRSSAAPWLTAIVGIEKTGRGSLVSTQQHFRMEGRDLVRVYPADKLPSEFEPTPQPSMYPEWPSDGYRWAMLIDLATCLGCNACVIACQAENNIPVVGKDQVARGREMHWLRIDRYILGDVANPQIVHQPVPCMHCEHAPCEVVCPVSATVHSSEGLNDMVYNRCVGTRYCSNNCPYKVRRFNFLDYRAKADSPVALQKNPEVTVRERGVMEKCTYCVQRINAARIAAEKEKRRIRDGEVRTACQQACPVEAIVFGDLAAPESAVARRKGEPTHYALLEELNTRPRTTYLARTINPARTV